MSSGSVLILGGAGFIGAALRARASTDGARVVVAGRTPRTNPLYRTIDASGDAGALAALLDEVQPDVVFHLVGGPGGDPFARNVVPARQVLRSLELARCKPRVVMTGSAAEYGDLGPEPLAEDRREVPVNEYGVAKLAQTRLAMVARRRGHRVQVARVFNVIGPGMDEQLAPARFARIAVAASRGEKVVLTTGDLSPVRDFVDVQQVADGLWRLAMAQDRYDLVNVCSGHGIKMRQVLDAILAAAGVELTAQVDPSLVRGPADIAVSIGSCQRFESSCGARLSFDLQSSVVRLVSAAGGRER